MSTKLVSPNLKHTPGPWNVTDEPNCPDGPHSHGIEGGPDGYTIADVNSDIPRGSEEADANARLIAHAPVMLDAIERAMAVLHPHAIRSSFDEIVARGGAFEILKQTLEQVVGE